MRRTCVGPHRRPARDGGTPSRRSSSTIFRVVFPSSISQAWINLTTLASSSWTTSRPGAAVPVVQELVHDAVPLGGGESAELVRLCGEPVLLGLLVGADSGVDGAGGHGRFSLRLGW